MEAIVLSVDPERERISLGIKQMEKDPVSNFMAEYPKGSIIKGSYAIAKNFNANFTYFINDVGLKSGEPFDFKRLQLDLSFKY